MYAETCLERGEGGYNGVARFVDFREEVKGLSASWGYFILG